jgi:stage V sporulation protein G
MKITDVKVYPFKHKNADQAGKLKAYATIVFEDSFIVRDLKLIEGQHGLFVSMPSRRVGGMYKNIVHPLNTETRQVIENMVINEYSKTEAYS